MWRITRNQDSDQSISDENDERDPICPEKSVSLVGISDRKKESLGVASQLELLKGLSQDLGFSSEDEVEIPDFHVESSINSPKNDEENSFSFKGDGFSCKLDELISVDEKGSKMLVNSVIAGATVPGTLNLHTRRKEKQLEASISYAVDKDARRRVSLVESSRCSSYLKDKHLAKGSRGKTKTRSSAHYKLHKKETFLPSVQKDEDTNSACADELIDEPEVIEYQPMKKSTSKHLGDSDGEKTSEPNIALPVEDIQHAHSRHTVVELLDDICGKNRTHQLKSKMGHRSKGRMGKHALFRSLVSSEEDKVSDEDCCELVHSGSSTDNEENAQNLELAVVETERKTMADKFQEAFGSISVISKQSGAGLFGRLQQVMQWQKEQDTEFLKKLPTEVWPKDKARCIDVKILSRSFEAKLIVCQCSLLENEESSLQNSRKEHFGKIWTIIFNTRICGDVDLEVGNFVRIHPPWKEVQVLRGGEIIILTTYFSQIYT